ncbi:MAG: hypothetical protein D6795_17630 [Deltaproteobacteria bacterium]|nr:MAG: hypothetical protein D6795_17630 [Deltaproteobacteria bacterium]
MVRDGINIARYVAKRCVHAPKKPLRDLLSLAGGGWGSRNLTRSSLPTQASHLSKDFLHVDLR